MMIKVLLFLSCFITYGQCDQCKICITGSLCTDDYIYFNISIPNQCKTPVNTYFNYDTDIDAEKHYLNTSFACNNCQVSLTIDSIHDAWDYILTLKSPTSTQSCSTRRARCGGYTSRYIWIGTGGLSGLFIILGIIFATVRYCRIRKRANTIN